MTRLRQESFACAVLVFLVGCSGKRDVASQTPESPLSGFLFQADELHASLHLTDPETTSEVPADLGWTSNPEVSEQSPFLEAVARGGSQGRLDSAGMRAALYARYTDGMNEIGVYGLEAKSMKDADQREALIREIWAHNESLDRTRVYRRGRVLFVVWLWTKEDAPLECWESTKRRFQQRLDKLQAGNDG
ncbi:MAG: hypothetical protein AAFX06_20770 [Planctomycetota bacterium]